MERNSIAGQTASRLNREIDDLQERLDAGLSSNPAQDAKALQEKQELLAQVYKGANYGA
jgi:hypothetical protein